MMVPISSLQLVNSCKSSRFDKSRLSGTTILVKLRGLRGYSLMVKFQSSKLAMRVRFPLPALPRRVSSEDEGLENFEHSGDTRGLSGPFARFAGRNRIPCQPPLASQGLVR